MKIPREDPSQTSKKPPHHMLLRTPVILLQIAMVSPGTHVVKNNKSLSITNESQLKKENKESLISKMVGP